ncbi:solute carrier organic anion transporter family member 2B1-like [Megalops cyprinoides]|uniref:solute carrier organic anion transporter family member 2B1-like n=1 Tax=Megalops cyprinoides TaxID=118141 RepID=UPI001863AB5F|nr:solute carrier organic anion transporter family member 2B1-like [Megalops cyprinoides]
MTATDSQQRTLTGWARPPARCRNPLNNIKFFVFCHSLLQLAQLLVSGYLKSSISTIERRYGFSSQKSGLFASFNEVGNTALIVFVSFFGSRIHRPRFIGGGALIASLAGVLIALPHFLTGPYEFSHSASSTQNNSSGLCHTERTFYTESSHQNCTQQESNAHQEVFPIMLLGQLLLGIGGVPVQPFGISYIDDYASKNNSPFYLGILFAVTVIGPAVGFMLGSFMLRFYVDIDKPGKMPELTNADPRWVGAWWLGFLLAAGFLFLTSLPYFFFPRKMPKEETTGPEAENEVKEEKPKSDPFKDLSLVEFLKSFPSIVLRTLKNPIYLLVVLAQVNLAAMVAGLATFMAKFIERQFTKTASLSNMIIGGVNIPAATVGIMAGGAIMKRLSMSVKASALMCTIAVLLSVVFGLPLLFLGCPTQDIAGVYPLREEIPQACGKCSCETEDFNPVCGSNGVEYRSPCHAGCMAQALDTAGKVLNYTDCSCIGSVSFAVPGTCGSRCSHFFLPFIIFSALTGLVASFSQTPSFMMILRTVKPEDKSFAIGVQYMLFRVLAFMPGPVLYGSAIDTTCILWGKKCKKNTSCHYYNLDLFRRRFLGLQVFFIIGAFFCFLLSFLVLRKMTVRQQQAGKPDHPVEGDKSDGSNMSKMLLSKAREAGHTQSTV